MAGEARRIKRSQVGRLIGYTHIEIGLSPTDNGSQGRLLDHEKYTIKINSKLRC